jgi:hypothetical protein
VFGRMIAVPGMRRSLAALAVAAALLPSAASAAAPPPIGVFSPFDGSGPLVARLELPSLRPAQPRLRIGEYHDDWSFSPDGTQLALGMGGAGRTCGRGICIVDVDSMSIAGYVPGTGPVQAVGWLRPRRIVGVLHGGGVVLADPIADTAVRTSALPFTVDRPPAALTSEGLAFLAGRRSPRLVVANARGDVRTAELPRIGPRAGMTADGRRARAFVVGAGRLVADVDLRTMDVRYRRVARPARRRAFTEAVWLGGGHMAVYRDGASGVQVIDTRAWTARTVAPGANGARRAAGRLLVYSDGEAGGRGVGLRVYTRDGRRLIRHLLGRRELAVEVAGRTAYGFASPGRPSRRARVVRVRTGELAGVAAPPPRGNGLGILSSRIGSAGLPR